MKKLLLGLIIVATVVSNVFAAVKEKSLGFEISNYKYEEHVNNEVFMNLKGERFGITYDYLSRKRTGKSPFWSLQLGFSYGDLTYDGSDQDQIIKFKVKCRTDFYTEERFLYGLYMPYKNEQFALMPYFGLGIRGLFNRIKDYYLPNQNGKTIKKIPGYDRYSLYFYLPIGANFRFNLNRGWQFDLNPEFDFFLIGQQTSGKVNGQSVKNLQYSGYGLRLSGKISKKISDNTSLFFGPFVKYWKIADSEIKDAGYEPKNDTLECGVKVGISF